MVPGELLELWGAQLGIGHSLGQLAAPPTVTYVNPQIFVAIVAGLLMAFAFQLFLTNLGIAIGVTALGFQINRKRDRAEELPKAEESEAEPENSVGDTVRTIGFAAGFGILFTINVVLFAACFLAAKLSLVTSPFVGAILGIVIWSAYFLILTWVSSTAVSSLVGTVLGGAAAGFRGIVATASAAFKDKDQPYMTEATAMKAIRQEVKSAFNSGEVQDSLKEYVVRLQPPQLDLSTVREEVQTLLKSPEAVSLMGSNLLKQVNRQTFVDLIRRSDLSKRDAEQVVDQLDALWQQTLLPSGDGSLLDFLQSASPDQLKARFSGVQPSESPSATPEETSSSNGLMQSLQELSGLSFSALNFNTIKQTVLNRVDLSELDIEQVWQQLTELRRSILGQSDSSPFSTVRADVEGFLLGAYAWDLGHKALKNRFREVLYDPNAAPDLVRQQLESIAPEDFVEILQQREDLPPEKIDQIADRLEAVRQEVLETIQSVELPVEPPPQPSTEAAAELWQKLEAYFRYTKVKQFTPKKVDRKLQTLFEEAQSAVPGGLILPDFDRTALENLLTRRKGWEPNQIEEILEQVAAAWEPFSVAAASSEQTRIDRLVKTISNFLQKGDGLSQPELIERLSKLGIGSWAIEALKAVDWQVLAPQIDPAHLHQVQEIIYQLAKAPRRWATRTQKTAWQFGDRLQTYLQAVDPAELNLEGIKTSLTRLIEDAKQRGHQIEELFSAIDRATLAAALGQREDLSEPEIEQVIEQIESVCDLLQAQAQQEQETERSAFEALLGRMRRSLSSLQFDFDPDHIKQDLYQLLDLPQAGLALLNDSTGGMLDGSIDSLRERLSHFNRETLAKLMQARDDFSETVSSRVIDQVETVRDQIMQQVEQVQLEAQRQLDDLKQQAQQRAEETRKAATIAAWWLFCTALTSLTSATVAGIIGVSFSL